MWIVSSPSIQGHILERSVLPFVIKKCLNLIQKEKKLILVPLLLKFLSEANMQTIIEHMTTTVNMKLEDAIALNLKKFLMFSKIINKILL